MNRRRFLHHASTSFVAALSARCASEVPTRGDRRTRIEQLMVRLHQKEEFTGEILVAERGHVVFEGAFGTADHGTGRPYTTDTRSCLASLSKPITATAIVMLAEQTSSLTTIPCRSFLPGFSDTMGAVTIRHLLTHTSGIPDYPDLNVDHPGITNAEILAA
jgi:CubicO group peptidase (beta-lactamase class C family)